MNSVEVVPHNPNWRAAFEIEASQITKALGETVVAIHHIGSTSISGIYAKPIIDILVEVTSLAEVDERNQAMQSLGYEAKGEFGIAGRRYFRKSNQAGIRTHHVHMFVSGAPEVTRHLAFRDYLITHPDEAQRYSELKRELAAVHSHNQDGYIDGKDGFIKAIDQRAAQWLGAQLR